MNTIFNDTSSSFTDYDCSGKQMNSCDVFMQISYGYGENVH